ncbi:hypothetical protein [Smaragdicoccus niigatensis]|uniref:hypothetical protein n=1 Tax=Smaragdicoccus niigatensis TaxID=359359 RepID=UPI0003785B93|nr:hypothetical protein [Smaragdicoccus niigatensis]
MDTSTLVWLAVVVIAGILLGVGSALASRRSIAKRHSEADIIRDRATQQERQATEREALADEAAANARAMQAQAEAKAAIAARLHHGAEMRREEAVSARAEVDGEFERADKIDPAVKSADSRDDGATDKFATGNGNPFTGNGRPDSRSAGHHVP